MRCAPLRSSFAALVAAGLFVAGASAQDTLLERLQGTERETRDAAELELARLDDLAPARDWIARFEHFDPELRLRLSRGLARHPRIWPVLLRDWLESEEGGQPGPGLAALWRAFVHAERPAPPSDPDALYPLPIEPVDVRGIRDLVDLLDRCAIGGVNSLPILLDPRLAAGASLARRPLELDGCWLLRELLPDARVPGSFATGPLQLGITAPASFVVGASHPVDFAEFGATCFEQLRHPDPVVRGRAALELGQAELPALASALADLARDGEGEPARLARLVLAASRVRGHRRPADHELGAAWLADLRAATARPLGLSERVWLGHALRSLLLERPEAWPAWFEAAPRWTRDPIRLALVAELPLPRAAAALEDDVPPPGEGRTAALRCLRFAPGTLAPARVQAFWREACAEETNDSRRAALLELLRRRAGDVVPWGDGLPPGLWAESAARGRLLVHSLGSEGAAQRALVQTIAGATTLQPGHFGLLEVFGSMQAEELRQARAEASTELGRMLCDLAIGELAPLRVRDLETRSWLQDAHARLAACLPGGEAPWGELFDRPELRGHFAERLGGALARLRLAMPVSPDGQSLGTWLLELLRNVQTRDIGLGAVAVAIRERATLRVELGLGLRRIDAGSLSLLARLRELVLRRPPDLALAPLPPEDPLLTPR